MRSVYVLIHQGEMLLSVDAALTPPFIIGEDIKIHDEQTGESMGWFLVEKILRIIPFRTIANGERVALAGQEVTVHLRRRVPVEEKKEDASHVL